MGKDKKKNREPSSVTTTDSPPPVVGDTVETPVEVSVPPAPVIDKTPRKPWVTGIFYTLPEIGAVLNELESLGFKVTHFDYERHLGGEYEVIYRVEKTGE